MAEITGKIIAVLPTRSGTSARGTQWSSQTSVIETHEQYPKRVAFDVLGDKITEFNLQVGEEVTVSPFSPLIPIGPVGPIKPVGPASPFSPAGPLSPDSPLGPTGP